MKHRHYWNDRCDGSGACRQRPLYDYEKTPAIDFGGRNAILRHFNLCADKCVCSWCKDFNLLLDTLSSKGRIDV